jgi:spore coat polysaccharide biosynthesis protein SpsF
VTVLVVVQARIGSTRLPGKVMKLLGGRAMLQLQLERLQAGAEPTWNIVVATSTSPVDDPIASLAAEIGVPVVRGPELDVLARFELALQAHPAPTVVRLTGDCPLSDPSIVRDAVDLHLSAGAAYTSNVFPRSFPKGLDVEVISAEALYTAATAATDARDREHVTPYIVRRPEQFALATIFSNEDLGEEWWTVDRPEDLDRLREMVDQLDDPVRSGWRDVLAIVGRSPAPSDVVHLRPLAPPAPGSNPWERSWSAELGGLQIGTARVGVGGGTTTITIDAPGQTASVEQALSDLLANDVQVIRPGPS